MGFITLGGKEEFMWEVNKRRSFKRRLFHSRLQSISIHSKDTVTVNLSAMLESQPLGANVLKRSLYPNEMVGYNEVIESRYASFSQLIMDLDKSFSRALSDLIQRQRAWSDNDEYQRFLSFQYRLMIKALRLVEQVIVLHTGMHQMRQAKKGLMNLFLSYRCRTKDVELKTRIRAHNEEMDQMFKCIDTVIKVKESADCIRTACSYHDVDSLTEQPPSNQLNPDANNGMNDTVLIDIERHGFFSEGCHLATREVCTRAASVCTRSVISHDPQRLLMGVACGLLIGSAIVLTDGLILPFLPVLDFAVMQIATMVLASLSGGLVSQLAKVSTPLEIFGGCR
jgi:hypothetical protein